MHTLRAYRPHAGGGGGYSLNSLGLSWGEWGLEVGRLVVSLRSLHGCSCDWISDCEALVGMLPSPRCASHGAPLARSPEGTQ